MQRSAFCRSRRELSNAYFLANFGFDTAENEACKVCLLSATPDPPGPPEHARGPRRGGGAGLAARRHLLRRPARPRRDHRLPPGPKPLRGLGGVHDPTVYRYVYSV